MSPEAAVDGSMTMAAIESEPPRETATGRAVVARPVIP
jgi:hypothetical protein